MNKVVKVILLCILICFSFSACTANREEIKNRVIIEAIGLDKKKEGIRVTFQYLNTKQIGGKSVEKGNTNISKTVSFDASSIENALEKIGKTTGKEPMTSHNRVIILDKELCKNGIMEYLDYFVRSSADRATVLLAVSENKAEDILNIEIEDNLVPADEIKKVIENSYTNSKVVSKRIYQFINDINSKTTTPILPIISLNNDEPFKILLSGFAIFKNDKLTMNLDKKYAEGILWLTNQYRNGTISFNNLQNENITLNISKSKTQITFDNSMGIPTMHIKTQCQTNWSEGNFQRHRNLSEAEIKNLSTLAEEAIKNKIQQTMDICIKELQIDIFGVGNRLWRQHPRLYRDVSDNWSTFLPTLNYKIDVKVKIARIGNDYLLDNLDSIFKNDKIS